MVFGAGWAGARAMTSTSGPGVSLMAEYVGYGYYAEIPGVIFDVQRAGPSTGLPTRTMQGDVAFAYTLSHGDTKHIVLLPATIEEAYELAMDAFDLADRFQTPVFVLSRSRSRDELVADAAAALSGEAVRSRKSAPRRRLNKVQSWGRYRDVDKDGIPYRTVPGTEHTNAGFFTRGTGHDEEARYSEQPDVWQRNLDRLVRKHETARRAVPAPIVDDNRRTDRNPRLRHDASRRRRSARPFERRRYRSRLHARARAAAFPDVAKFIARHDRVYVVEQNRDGQLYGILRTELPTHLIHRLESIRHYNGVPIDAHAIIDPLLEAERQPAVVAE